MTWTEGVRTNRTGKFGKVNVWGMNGQIGGPALHDDHVKPSQMRAGGGTSSSHSDSRP